MPAGHAGEDQDDKASDGRTALDVAYENPAERDAVVGHVREIEAFLNGDLSITPEQEKEALAYHDKMAAEIEQAYAREKAANARISELEKQLRRQAAPVALCPIVNFIILF